MNRLWYSWKEMIRDMGVLCRTLTNDNFKPDVIVGLSRGGLTPGIMLSHWLMKPFNPIKAATLLVDIRSNSSSSLRPATGRGSPATES